MLIAFSSKTSHRRHHCEVVFEIRGLEAVVALGPTEALWVLKANVSRAVAVDARGNLGLG